MVGNAVSNFWNTEMGKKGPPGQGGKAASKMTDPFASFLYAQPKGSGFRVQGSGFRVQGPGFKVQGPGIRVQGSRGFKVDVGLKRAHNSRTPEYTVESPGRSV